MQVLAAAKIPRFNEIVVNSISAKNTISGYLSSPKVHPRPLSLLVSNRHVGRDH